MSGQANMNDVFLKGKNIVLKALTEDDVLNSNWYGWFNNEETTRDLQKHYFPNTKETQLKFYREEVANSERKLQLGICDAKGGPIIGVVSLNNIDHINRKAEISMVIGEAGYRKAHNVIEVFHLILSHGFNSLNLFRIYGGSLNKELVDFICRILGASPEGILRKDVYKDGEYHDVYLYGILSEEYRATVRRNSAEEEGA